LLFIGSQGRGVQLAMRINTFIVLCGAGIRMIPTGSNTWTTVLVHAGQFLNGLAVSEASA
jgi:hypothetical protein